MDPGPADVPSVVSRDFYDVLGVPRGADQETVRKAYRKVALESHPDRNPGDKRAEERFKEATTAFSVLNDPDKKQVYDLNLGFGRGQSSRFRDTQFHWSPQDIFEDILGAVRGGTRRPGGAVPNNGAEAPGFRHEWHDDEIPEAEPGDDIEENLVIALEEAAAGCLKDVASKSKVRTMCTACQGSGCRPGTLPSSCGSCSGSGRDMDWRPGPQRKVRKCPACHGFGSRPVHRCPECDGKRRIRVSRNVKVRVPAGIDTGQKLRLAGMGSPGNGGPPGDLYVTVHVAQHDRFHRKGADLYVDHAVPLHVAIRGGQAMVPTLDGPPVAVQVPPGVSPGKTVLTVQGAGMRSAGSSSRGGLHILIQVNLPRIMTVRGERLLEELVEEVERTNP